MVSLKKNKTVSENKQNTNASQMPYISQGLYRDLDGQRGFSAGVGYIDRKPKLGKGLRRLFRNKQIGRLCPVGATASAGKEKYPDSL